MEEGCLNQKLVRMQEKIDLYEQILDHVPAIIYVNTYAEPGNPYSLTNQWTNRFARKFIGYSQSEIDAMGFSFFTEVFHPDDLEVITTTEVVDISIAQPPETVYTALIRLKPKDSDEYLWTYGNSIQIETNEDGSPKSFLGCIIEITNQMHTQNQLIDALKEINRCKNDLYSQLLTKREMEVLHCIVAGLTNLEIAEKFFISIATAKTHRNNIIKKLGLKNTASLAAFAVECGLC